MNTVFAYYVFVEEEAREHINNLIRDADNERQRHEFLITHPECRTSAKIKAFLKRMLVRKHESEIHRTRALE